MTSPPTHAGGIVFRHRGQVIEYLLVRPRARSDEWVLPKGHIEPGEDPAEAAVREVREETGVVARIVGLAADNIRFVVKGKEVTVWFYLMERLNETQPAESRDTAWVPLDEALMRVKYDETREAIRMAERMRSASPGN